MNNHHKHSIMRKSGLNMKMCKRNIIKETNTEAQIQTLLIFKHRNCQSHVSIIRMSAQSWQRGPLSVWFYFAPTHTHSSVISSKDNTMCSCQKRSAQQCDGCVILMNAVSKPNRCKLLRLFHLSGHVTEMN